MTMTDQDRTRRAMDDVAHEIIKLGTIDRLARISCSRITNELMKQVPKFIRPGEQYLVGSKQEGFPNTATNDTDMMMCLPAFPIVLWKSQEKESGAFVTAEQDQKHPVYLRLKVVDKMYLDEDFKTIIDTDGYLKTSDFINVNYSINPFYNVKDYNIEMRQGPSIETKFNAKFVDFNEKTVDLIDVVHCLKCQSWPPFTSDFFTRKSLNNWPPQKLLNKVKDLECHVVPVGYPGSEFYDIEWRLSFSIAERELITEMYEPYAECMFALKSIKKKYIIYSDADKPTPFCSYFIKTACLWMCETFPHTDYSLMNLIRKVLDWLIDCYKHKHLPHYFIPQHNLIGHLSKKSCDNVREKLRAVKRNLWTKVLSVSNSETYSGCLALNFLCDRLNITMDNRNDDYSTLETTLLIHPEAATEIECMRLEFCSMFNSQKSFKIARLAVYNNTFLMNILADYFQKNRLKMSSIPEKLILPVVENIEEIVPKGYGEMFKTSLYRYLGNVYTQLNSGLTSDEDLDMNYHTPLHYYSLGAEMVFPDNHSDYGIGGQVLVVKYHYIMGNYEELKEKCDSTLENIFDRCLREKNCRIPGIEIVQLPLLSVVSASLYSGWGVDEILLHHVKCSGNLVLLCHPIIVVFYIKARVLLIEGDTESALDVVIKMKECKSNTNDPLIHETTNMFITIIESLVGLLAVMRGILTFQKTE